MVKMGLGRISFVALAFVVATQSGCKDDTQAGSLFISAHMSLDDMCALNTANAAIVNGVLDIAVRSTYDLFPLYNNQIITRADTSGVSSVNTSNISVEGARVTVYDSNGVPLTTEFAAAGSTVVPSATTEGPGQAVGGLSNVIPTMLGSTLAGRVGSTVFISLRAFGHTLGGLEVESGEFRWPVTICECCLNSGVPPSSDSPDCITGQDVPAFIEACN